MPVRFAEERVVAEPPAVAHPAKEEAAGPSLRIGHRVAIEAPRSAGDLARLRGREGRLIACDVATAADESPVCTVLVDETESGDAEAERVRVPAVWLSRVHKGAFGGKNLFTTRNVKYATLSEALLGGGEEDDGNGEGRFYRVPVFQRRYCWNEDNWRGLWASLEAVSALPPSLCPSPLRVDDDAGASAGPRHSLGRVLVFRRPSSNTAALVLDGQQRLTTCALLLRALEDRLTALCEVP